MADHAEFLLSPANLERFREQALQRARNFAIDRILPEYLGLYDRVLSPEAVD